MRVPKHVDPVQSRSVLRYFLPADSFVRIRLCGAGALPREGRERLDRSSYRRAVIRTCCPELAGDLERRLVALCPHDPLSGEDLLYQLCIEVNPELDIHTVRLPGGPERETREHALASDARPQARLSDLARAVRGIERRLAKRIVGQPAAVRTVARALERAAAGLADDGKPLASFLFLGRTGTGKTELARVLARELFGSLEHLVRVDCSEYGLGHEYSKLIGAPPGYVGHEHGGFLTEAVRKDPAAVVLFDEVEKAHPRLHHLLLQLLDDGHLTDGRGRRVDFSRTVVILTSNVGAGELRDASRRMGFAPEAGLSGEQLGEITSRALEQQFAPELLGRLGERVLFRDLEPAHACEVAGLLLADLARRTRRQGITVAFRPAVARWVAERGFSAESGARELVHVVRREIETRLAELVLEGRAARGRLVRVGLRGGEPSLVVER